MKFLKSRFFIVCLCVAVIIVLVPAVLAAFGQVDVVRSGLKTVAKPFEWCGSRMADAVNGFVSVFTEYDELVEENKQLRDTIESMKNDAADNEVLQKENQWLKDYLAGNFSTVLTLSKGKVHGIKMNMPVITANGVLGYVSEVGLDWCRVVSIIETSSKVGVYTDRSGVIGTVEGNLELRAEGKCLMSYAADADIKVGDRVYTSGTGSIYPGGLFIGRIVSIEADEATRSLMAVVEPSVDFSSLQSLGSVMIICGYRTQEAQ